MKNQLKLFTLSFVLMLTVNISFAQENEDAITDENLRRYALLMEVKDIMVAEISGVTNEMIRNQEGISGKRYLELTKGEGEPAQEFETKFVETVKTMQDERKAATGDVVKILATKMLPGGGRVYNEIKNAISSDAEVRERYEEILEEIKEAGNGDEAEETEESDL